LSFLACLHMSTNYLTVFEESPGISAAFLGRVSNLTVHADREEMIARLEGPHSRSVLELGFAWQDLARAEQVHGSEVAVVQEGGSFAVGADALVTNTPGVLLGIYVADCGAVYFHDEKTGAIGLAHSGKKGTEGNIVTKVLETMKEEFGSCPQDILVVLAPCIRPPSYEVDFAADIMKQALAAGVPREQYIDSEICTSSDLSSYYSYRAEKGVTGRMLALLGKNWTHVERAPAKVNLSLRVLGKREDGFHAIKTRMAPLNLCDVLRFLPADQYELFCEEEGVPLDESNLVTKAVRVFQRETGCSCSYAVHLEKNLPHGAGLGGGSSDAAAMLRALNVLEGAGLSLQQLSEMAAEIGSDVPFFVYNTICDCSGRGEVVSPVKEWSASLQLLLLKPKFSVSTPAAYAMWKDSVELPGVDYTEQIFSWGSLVNDLERPVYQKHMFLAEVKLWLLEQPEVAGALMSGSGSTMYAVLKTDGEELKQRALAELDPTMWAACVEIVDNL